MKNLIFCILTFFLIPNITLAQNSNANLANRGYLGIGLEYGIDAGLGGNVGYTNLGVDRWIISHISVSFLYKDDGVDRWGEDYTGIVGMNEFSQDIEDEGFSYLTMSSLLGLKITKGVHILGIIGYQAKRFIQQRLDHSTILSSDGEYYTTFRASDKGIGGGVGLKFFLPVSNSTALTPTIQYTSLKGASLSIGIAF
jgi:hypothetical protein